MWGDRLVAVKKIRESVRLAMDEASEDFEKEMKFMRTIRHTNIVLFIGVGHLDGAPILVTEFCARGTLKVPLLPTSIIAFICAIFHHCIHINIQNILCDAAIELPWTKRLGFALDAACGMRFLHQLTPPTMHRDLKSSNLLISESWAVKVADFGSCTYSLPVCMSTVCRHGAAGGTAV